MSETGVELVRRLHRDAVEQRRAHEAHKRALVQSMFEQAAARLREEQATQRALVEAVHREACKNPPKLEPSMGTHFSKLVEAKPGEPLADEWNTYRHEVGRLLEHHEGQHVLIKGQEIVGIFATADEAHAAGLRQFPDQPFFVHPIRSHEPFIRIRGVNLPWVKLLSP